MFNNVELKGCLHLRLFPTLYSYDELHRLTQKEFTTQGWSYPSTLHYEYDANGNVTKIWSSTAERGPGGRTSVRYQWDALNRLTNVINEQITAPNETSYTYDAAGNLRDYLYPNGVRSLYTYDERNRLTLMTVSHGTDPRASFGYTVGSAGQRIAANETVAGVSRQLAYTYDNLYRLTREAIGGAAPITGTIDYGPQQGSEQTTGYDSVGNRRSRQVSLSPTAGSLPNVLTVSSFNGNDWLEPSSNFDANGNTKRGDVSPVQTEDDAYDFENRLIYRKTADLTVRLSYDGDGNRVRKQVTGSSGTTNIFYLVDDRNPTGYAQVLEEHVLPGMDESSAVARCYGHMLISQVNAPPNGPVQYYGYDGHGNVRFLTDANGAITDTYTYDAFGILIAETHPTAGATPNNNLYCGEYFEPELGLYYNRARHLNLNTGRFWTMDMYEGGRGDPFSLHKFVYAHDNPGNRIDPLGHFDLIQVLGTAFVGGVIAAISAPYTVNAPRIGDPTYPPMTGEELMANFTVGFITLGTGSAASQGVRAFVSRRLRAPVASYSETFGETILKDVPDNAYVHFTLIENKPVILAEGLKYTDGGVGTHLFKAGEVKGWTITQARAAVGELAGSSRANAIAIVSRETAEAAGLEGFENFSWTEYVTRQQQLPVLDVRGVGGAGTNTGP